MIPVNIDPGVLRKNARMRFYFFMPNRALIGYVVLNFFGRRNKFGTRPVMIKLSLVEAYDGRAQLSNVFIVQRRILSERRAEIRI